MSDESAAKSFTVFASKIAYAMGKPITFAMSLVIVAAWAVSGSFFDYSDTWQLVINTGTTIITFLMVFLIQNTQNRDSAAIQAKLDELIRAGAAQNRYNGIEQLSEEELTELRDTCATRARGERLTAAEAAADKAEEDANRKAASAAQKAGSFV